MAIVDKLQQIGEKLPHIGGANKIFQPQIADSAAQINPQILFVEHAEILVRAFEQVEAVIVKRRGMNRFPAEQLAQALAHLGSRIIRIGEGQNLVRLRMPIANQARNAMGQNRSLPRARAGHHEHRPADMFDGFALAVVRDERRGR